jgi:CRP-like cAMP-binding protein
MLLIREAELFRGVASHIIDEIAGIASEEVFSSGCVIFKEEDFAEYLYILEEGVIEIAKIEIAIEGEVRISMLLTQPGYVFGWSALVEPRRYTAAATCLKDSKVIKLDGDRLMRIFEKHPAEGLTIMKRLAGVIASRLDSMDRTAA